MDREWKLKRTEFTRLSESTGYCLAPSTRRVLESSQVPNQRWLAKTRSWTLQGRTSQATSSFARRRSSANSTIFFHYHKCSSGCHMCSSGSFLQLLARYSCFTSVDLPQNCQTLAKGFAFFRKESEVICWRKQTTSEASAHLGFYAAALLVATTGSNAVADFG